MYNMKQCLVEETKRACVWFLQKSLFASHSNVKSNSLTANADEQSRCPLDSECRKTRSVKIKVCACAHVCVCMCEP